MSGARHASATLGAVLGVALLVGLPGRAAAEGAAAGALQRLEQAAAAHPDDPDLAWAWVRALARQGDPVRALEQLEGYRARWPGRRPEAERLLAELWLATGRPERALTGLDPYLAEHRDDGVAHFYRGMALRALHRPEEAARALARARRLEPRLAAESLVLQALDEIAAGDASAGRRLLERALTVDPQSEIAAQARRLLAEQAPPRRPLSLSAYGGIEYDSNVILDSGVGLPGVSLDKEDLQGVWGASALWRPELRGRTGFTLGYRYDQSAHDDLASYDLQSHLVFAALLVRLSETTAIRLDSQASRLRLDGDGYLRTIGLRPNFFLAIGPGGGILRAWARLEQETYDDDPLLDSLERDGWVAGAGLEHTLPLERWGRGRPGWGHDDRTAWITFGGGFERTDTDADRDLFGLAGAYDHDLWEGRVRVRLPLPWRLEARSGLRVGLERYAHRNVIDLLTDDGVGTLTPTTRRDTLVEARVALTRPLHRRVDVELAWRGTHRVSNVDLYDYDRHVVGLYLRATTP